MDKTMDKIHGGLLRKFHTLCSRLGLNPAEKEAIVSSYGVESSADIDTHDLINICAALSDKLNAGKNDELDKLPKRAMAAIGGYLRMTKQPSSAEIIKGIACRATGHQSFNKIPAERLRNLYSAFRNKQKDFDAVDALTVKMYVDGMTGSQTNTILN